MSGEFAFIDRIRGLTDPGDIDPNVRVGIGDDCAVLAGGLLFALDTMVDGVHFRLDWCTPQDVGWKALAVNLSDIAAMGGQPMACVVGLTVPTSDSPKGPPEGAEMTDMAHPPIADQVMRGIVEAATTYGCPLVGGDTTSGPNLVISVAVIGSTSPPWEPVLRSGAVAGDAVFVTGVLGASADALDYLLRGAGHAAPGDALRRLHRPVPRLREGAAVARAGVSAMIDISDGLGADLAHICDSSSVGVRIDADAVPVADGVSLDRALAGGDDYELCFAAPDPDRVRAVFAEAGLDAPHQIGVTTEASAGRLLVDRAGKVSPFPRRGWQHSI